MYLKASVAFVLLIMVSCQPTVEQIQYGRDACAYCKMTISDRKYGAELVTQKGKVFKFDATECMLDYLEENRQNYAHNMVVPFDDPGILHPSDSLTYLVSPNLPSPMGAFISAFSQSSVAGKIQQEKSGELFSWDEIQRKFDEEKESKTINYMK